MSAVLDQDEKEHRIKVLINEPKALAKQRLMDFAAGLPLGQDDNYTDIPGTEVTYSELIERATDFQKHGDYWSEGGRFEGTGVYEGFWADFTLVTEIPVTDNYGFFSCNC